MNLKTILYVGAAVFLLAACESTSMEEGGASGQGAAAAPSSGSSSMASAPTAEIVAGSPQDFVVNVGDRVFFDFDKSNLKPAARATLEAQAAWLKKYPAVTVTVEGHCDERGTREYNLGLGERRANSAKDYLIALGISPSRIQTISYGKERPVALGHNEEAWSQNRRSVTVIRGGAAGS